MVWMMGEKCWSMGGMIGVWGNELTIREKFGYREGVVGELR